MKQVTLLSDAVTKQNHTYIEMARSEYENSSYLFKQNLRAPSFQQTEVVKDLDNSAPFAQRVIRENFYLE